MELSEGEFQVQVQSEGWLHGTSPSLIPCFGSRRARERMWSRRVLLQGRGETWVEAHTLIPASSLDSPLRRLLRLRDRPLGGMLFRHPQLRRGGMEVCRTREGWGRRSLFYLYGKPLLVAEFFRPVLLQAADDEIHALLASSSTGVARNRTVGPNRPRR